MDRTELEPEQEFELDSILEILDDIEKEIEAFKKKAQSLAEEKSRLESTLGVIINDFKSHSDIDSEEVAVKAERLSQRLDAAAKIYIEIPRDSCQTDAIIKLEKFISHLDELPKNVVVSFHNATCGKDPFDQKFESIFLACSIDDQKFIKSKLEKRIKEIN
ncbi:BAG family molecular chaperone regulator 2 [Lepeophtheirus salmonis]|uniref:BAG family molecular chaperone regulator 2 n=1 Tax=Lepeophtheirus salmonis TaxID=72036 RepID=UPI001AE66C6A|nr:BAG family molecular chaperone regulator 2-like [Lepeophtheirus salmonis]